MTSAVTTRAVQRDSDGNLTTDSTGQPLPEGYESTATAWISPGSGPAPVLPAGEEVEAPDDDPSCSDTAGAEAGWLMCTRSANHPLPHRGGVGGQRLRGEWAIPVDPEPKGVRIRLKWNTRANLEQVDTITLSTDVTEEQVRDYAEKGWTPSSSRVDRAIRNALRQVGGVSTNNGYNRSSIEILDDAPVSLDSYVGNRVAEMHTAPVQAELDKVKAELAAFKLKVAEVGERYAKEHGFCSVYDSVIEELGLTRPVPEPETYEFDLTVTLKVRGTVVEAGRDVYDAWVQESIARSGSLGRIEDSGVAQGLLDSDWDPDATEILGVGTNVRNVQKVST